jgi:hypothetical protein
MSSLHIVVRDLLTEDTDSEHDTRRAGQIFHPVEAE